jgi:hypothetical protein
VAVEEVVVAVVVGSCGSEAAKRGMIIYMGTILVTV